jgi:hypothetical protein
MKRVADFLFGLADSRRDALLRFHAEHLDLMQRAKGSSHNHQTWNGGYLDHLGETFRIAEASYEALSRLRPLPFSLASAVIVLYFHDLEKVWKYATGEIIDKPRWYAEELPARGIAFSPQEQNALRYIHGEDDYSSQERKMGELAAFCHCCDVLSACMWWDQGQGMG